MPVWKKGSAIYFGLLRHEDSKDEPATLMTLDRKYHVWDVRKQAYLGHLDHLTLNLDLEPRFFALLPVNPCQMTIAPQADRVNQGQVLAVTGQVRFDSERGADAAKLGHVVHARVYAPDGSELEWFRKNIVFDGAAFHFVLPISYTEKPGVYSIAAEHTVTGLKAQATFTVEVVK